VIGSVIYNQFAWNYKSIVEPVDPQENIVTLFEPPLPRDTYLVSRPGINPKKIDYQVSSHNMGEEEPIVGVASRKQVNGFYRNYQTQLNLQKKMQQFLNDMFEHTTFESEKEVLEMQEEKLEEMLYILQLVKKYPNLTRAIKSKAEIIRKKYKLHT
jgi:hypothetical protein